MNTRPKPYYQDSHCTIYNADCREILPLLEPVDLVLTDPPYGIGVGAMGMGKGAKNNHFKRFDWDDIKPDTALINQVVLKGLNYIVWGANYFRLPPSPCCLSWDKIQVFSGADFELASTSAKGPSKCFRMSRVEAYGSRPRLHPTEKPIELIKWCISFFPKSQTILDPFMGSGTTLRAAKDLNRKAIGIELEEKYCEIAVERLRQEVLAL